MSVAEPEAGAAEALAPAEAPPRISALFLREGTQVAAGADRAFLLQGDGAWVVERGRVDVFAVRIGSDGAPGTRRHLFRVGAGQPLLAATSVSIEEDVGLLAVGTAGTRLLALPQRRMREAVASGDGGDEVLELVDAWASLLAEGIAVDRVPKLCDEVDAGTEVDAKPGDAIRPRSGVVWMRHLTGASHLLGRPGLRVDGGAALPLARRAWVVAADEARLRFSSAPVDAAEAWEGIALLNALVLRWIRDTDEDRARAAAERLRKKAALDRSTLANACTRLVSAFDEGARRIPGMRLRASDTEDEDALFAAARLVGDAMGATVRPSPPGEKLGSRSALDSIARASRLRTRRVLLRDGWWREDSGPLVAYVEEDKRPVAILPAKAGRYVLCDPIARTRVPLDAAVAATLSPFAHSLSRPFPETALKLGDVLRFGARDCGRDLTAVLLLGAAGGAIAALSPVAIGVIFNTVIPGAERGQLFQSTVVLLALAIAGAMFQVTRTLALIRIEGKMTSALQSALWDRLLSLPVGFFRGYTAGDLATRAMGIDAIRQILSGATVTALIGTLFSLFNFALLFIYDASLAKWATLLVGIAVAVSLVASWLQLRHQRELSKLQAEISGTVFQFLTGISKLRVAGAEVQAFAMWAKKFGEQRRLRFAVRRIGTVLAAFNAAFPTLAALVIFAFAAQRLSSDHAVRTGDLLAFLAAFGSFQAAILSTSAALVAMLTVIPYYENASPILTALPESDLGRADPGALAGEIEVQHLRFRYTADGPWAMDDLSLHVKPGEFVALVGPSGSGKSTLLRVLLGFETCESGSIYYDGQELGGLDVLAVRRQIGVVLQNGRLMPGDVFSNIVGSSLCTLDDAWEAARMAGLDADIKAMPMGMHTVVSEGASTLSGGQRQRLMIARAVVTRPRILFFDEATSALDNRTQAIVRESLAGLQATRVVIAHRLSTVAGADRIVVVKSGRIVQSGAYDDLMRQAGPFADLAKRQLA
jgi:ATP-binding cassette subfamily C protein